MKGDMNVAYWLKFLNEKYATQATKPTDGTIRTYAYNLAWLAARMDGFSMKGTGTVPTPEDVVTYMDTNDVANARRGQSYTAMKVYHNCCGERNCSHRYCAPLLASKRATQANYAKQKKSPHESKNWVEHKDLKKFSADMRKQTFKFDKHSLWDKNQYAIATLAFILEVHKTFPLRRELASVNWGVAGSDDINWLDEAKQEIVYNKHKSAPSMGTVRHKLSRTMWRLWRLLKKQQTKRKATEGRMLLNTRWKPMTPNGYSTWLKREMKRCKACEKKTVGCMMIRHSVISHYRRNDMSMEKKDAFARRCLHSSAVNDIYRKLD